MRWSLILVVVSVAAAQKYIDPDAPATQRAAREALSRARVVAVVKPPAETGTHLVLASDELFEAEGVALKPEAEALLRKAVDRLRTHPASRAEIDGHTDVLGEAQFNRELSQRRAEAIGEWLVENGIERGRISTRGFGGDIPVRPSTRPDGSDDPEGRRRNRRIEIAIRTR